MSTIYRHTDDSGQWVTRDELARLADISVDTVIRDCVRHDLETRYDDRGRVLVCVEDFESLNRLAAGEAKEPETRDLTHQAMLDLQYDVHNLAREFELLRALIGEALGVPHTEL